MTEKANININIKKGIKLGPGTKGPPGRLYRQQQQQQHLRKKLGPPPVNEIA